MVQHDMAPYMNLPNISPRKSCRRRLRVMFRLWRDTGNSTSAGFDLDFRAEIDVHTVKEELPLSLKFRLPAARHFSNE